MDGDGTRLDAPVLPAARQFCLEDFEASPATRRWPRPIAAHDRHCSWIRSLPRIGASDRR